MRKSHMTILLCLVLVLGLVSQCLYVVDQRECALRLQLGEPMHNPTAPGEAMTDAIGPGLHFKLPFIQNIVFLDSRILAYDARSAEALTKDSKTIVLDNYVRWQIANPLLFYQTLGSVQRATIRLDEIVYSQLRQTVGRYDLGEVIAAKRKEIMDQVVEKANENSMQYGVKIVDVRIKRTDLPQPNQEAIFKRMEAERERQAQQYRAEGKEEAQKIRSTADKDKVLILANANREAQILEGQGDAEATRIFAEALSKNPEFYEFMRSLQAYKTVLLNKTRIILDPQSDFFRYMR